MFSFFLLSWSQESSEICSSVFTAVFTAVFTDPKNVLKHPLEKLLLFLNNPIYNIRYTDRELKRNLALTIPVLFYNI